MTVRRLASELTLPEFLDWIEYFRILNEDKPAKPLEMNDMTKIFGDGGGGG